MTQEAETTDPPRSQWGPLMWLAYRWSMMAAARSVAQNAVAAGPIAGYDDWRDRELRVQFNAHFGTADVAGKDVVDFGCGTGGLARHVRSLGAAAVVGVELSATQVARAPAADGVAYRAQSRADRVDLPDDSADVILCFDVIEHIMCYREVFREWARVLRPGGSVLAWWSLWRHPYGHHMHEMLPVPWAHMILTEPQMYEVAAEVYDSPGYRPRFFHLDAEGRRKPNPYRGVQANGYLNRLTTPHFEREVRAAGLLVKRREPHPRGGLRGLLARLPSGFGDFFASHVVYRLARPAAPRQIMQNAMT